MRFEIQKHTKRGIECFEKLGKLYKDNEAKNLVKTPTCTLFLSTGCIPYISNDLLKFLNHIPNIAEIPFTTM